MKPEVQKIPDTSRVPKKSAGPLRKRLFLAGILVLIIGGFFWFRSRSAPTTGRLILGKVVKGDLTETVTASGSVNAQTGAQVHIGSQVAGQIKKLNADVGSQLKAGDVIAELNLPDLKAQLDQAKAALAQAELKFSQEVSGVGITETTTMSTIATADASVVTANQNLKVAQSNLRQQETTTPSDIRKASSGLNVATSSLTVAQSNLKSVQATSNLAVVNANEQLAQAQANSANASLNEKRELELVNQGFAAKTDYDVAHAQALVNVSQVRAAEQNVTLTKEKVKLDIQTAHDQVSQAEQNVLAARATLDLAMSEKNVNASRAADVQAAQASIRQANAAVQLANASRANNTIKAQNVRIAADAVQQAKAAVAYNQAQYNKSFIRTPISGTVLQLSAQQGETVSAGLSTQTLILVADLRRLQIDAYVDETDVAKLKLGQPVRFSVSAYPGKQYDGTVAKIASGSTIQQGVVTYDVTVMITDKTLRLKPDMTANVTIETGRRKGVLLIPAVAIQAGTKGSTVNVMRLVDGKQEVTPVKVVTGGTDGASVEIVSGLNAGDQIVLAGTNQSSMPPASSPFGAQGGGGGGGRGGGGGGGGR